MKHLIFALCLVASFAQAQVSQRYAARIYRVGDQLVIADSLGKNQTVYPFTVAQIVATNSLVRINISGLSKYYTPPKILSNLGVPYSLTSTTAAVAGILATVPDGTIPTDVTQIGGVKLTDYQLDRTATDLAIDSKLTVKTSASFTSAIESKIQYDNSTWTRKAGSYTANGGTVVAGPNGFYYERDWSGMLPITYFKNLVSNGDWKPAFDAAQNYLNSSANNQKGGTIFVNTDVCNVSGLFLQARITIEGTGRGTCIIRLINGSNANVITFPKTAIFAGLRHITIDGNKANNTTGHGIYIEPALDSDGHSQNQIWDKSDRLGLASSYSYFQMEDVTVTNAAQDGINILGASGLGANYAMYFNNVFTEYNGRDGIYNRSTDNLFNNIYSEKNSRFGINEQGSNNKWSVGKAIWNAYSDTTGAGINIGGARNSFLQFETQDNLKHGYVIGGTDNFLTNCLADGNGYDAVSTQKSNRKSIGFNIVAANGAKFSNCKATNYRGLQSDNYFIQNQGFRIDGSSRNIGQPDIYVSNRHNIPSLTEGTQTKQSAEIITYRPATATINSTTFAAGEPAILADGLHFDITDRLVIPRTIEPKQTLSLFMDYTHTSSTGTASRLLGSDNDNLRIVYTNDGSGTSPSVDFRLKAGGVEGVVKIVNYALISGRSYRVALRARLFNGAYRLDGYVSYIDSLGVPHIATNVGGGTFSTSIDAIRNPTINANTDKITGVLSRILVSPDIMSETVLQAGQDPGGYVNTALLYANYKSYVLPSEMQIVGTLPPANAFYRGMTLYQANGSYHDIPFTCIRRLDGVYVWVNMTFANNTTGAGLPSSGNWNAGQIVWNSSPSAVSYGNGSSYVTAGYQQLTAGTANFKPLLLPTDNPYKVGSGAAYPLAAVVPSGTFILWNNTASSVTNIWWNSGGGIMRAFTPVYGNSTITGNGSTTTFTIAHGLGYTPDTVTLTGLPVSGVTKDATNISFTTVTTLANSSTAVIYWTAK